jgi:hypothetical protein
MIDSYTQLAARFRQKREVELAMADLQKQALASGSKLARVRKKYGRIKAEEKRLE